jgi:hypothetical protein
MGPYGRQWKRAKSRRACAQRRPGAINALEGLRNGLRRAADAATLAALA